LAIKSLFHAKKEESEKSSSLIFYSSIFRSDHKATIIMKLADSVLEKGEVEKVMQRI
jgi:hypothetical protein